MRIRSLAMIAALFGCRAPYPLFVASSGMFVPPSVKKDPLSPAGATGVVTNEARACAFLGLATGVGGAKDQYVASSDAEVPAYREEAIVALRNVVAARGGTHVVIDATVVYGHVRHYDQVILRGRAFRC